MSLTILVCALYSAGKRNVVYDSDHAALRGYLSVLSATPSAMRSSFLVQTPHFTTNPDPAARTFKTFMRMLAETRYSIP